MTGFFCWAVLLVVYLLDIGFSSSPFFLSFLVSSFFNLSFWDIAEKMSHSPGSIDSPGDPEKAGVSRYENVDPLAYDPDAGLSDEERAANVMASFRSINVRIGVLILMTGQEACAPARLQDYPLGRSCLPPLLDVLLTNL